MEKIIHVIMVDHYDSIDNICNNHNVTGTQ